MIKLDLSNHQIKYKSWKERALKQGQEGIGKKNSDLLIQYIIDMEDGNNVGRKSKKGGRSYARLNNLRQRISWIMGMLEERDIKDITKLTPEQLNNFFNDMERGSIKTRTGEKYKSSSDYAKVFRAFWNWYMKSNRKKDIIIKDIAEDLRSTSEEEPHFVYFTKEQMDEMLSYMNKNEQIITSFIFDSIIRFPTEALSLQVKQIYEKDGDVWVNIPNEISKGGRGREFNLVYCGKAILEHIKENNLKSDDYLFKLSPDYYNWKIKQIAVQLFGDVESNPKAKGKFSEASGYDLRHSGAIHFRILAKENPGEISLDAIRQRGGWSDFKMLNYYTKFIGLDGKIDKAGLLIKKDKHKLVEEMETLKKRLVNYEKAMQERMEIMEQFVKKGENIKSNLNKPENKKIRELLERKDVKEFLAMKY